MVNPKPETLARDSMSFINKEELNFALNFFAAVPDYFFLALEEKE